MLARINHTTGVRDDKDTRRTETHGKKEKEKNPTQNLVASVLALITHTHNPLNALTVIMNQPKDANGNIFIGIDDKDFTLWRGALQHLVPTKVFGPILIPTSPKVISVILDEYKVGSPAHFSGNRSTDVVAELVGHDNVFSPKDNETHKKHKIEFKNFISNHDTNAKIVGPIIAKWIESHLQAKIMIDDQAISTLSAQIMLAFLLSPAAAANPAFCSAIQTVKSHFVRMATFKEVGMMRFFNGYRSAKRTMVAEIGRLYHADELTYPKSLANSGLSLEQATENVLSLMMVGFSNLQSSLVSLLVRYAKYPEYRHLLEKELIQVSNVPYIHFDPSHSHPDSFGQHFFLEALRLMPPVWLQARKNEKADRLVEYCNEAGEKKSFLLPAATLILIPNYALARNIEFGDEFLPDRDFKHLHTPYPFSSGPNACPGRNIAYAATGALIAALIDRSIQPCLMDMPEHDPSVALVYKNIQIRLQKQKKPGKKPESNPDVTRVEEKEAAEASALSGNEPLIVGSALLVFLFTLYESNNVLAAAMAGSVTAVLVRLFLSNDKSNLDLQSMPLPKETMASRQLLFSHGAVPANLRQAGPASNPGLTKGATG